MRRVNISSFWVLMSGVVIFAMCASIADAMESEMKLRDSTSVLIDHDSTTDLAFVESRSPTYLYSLGRNSSDMARIAVATSDGGFAICGYVAGWGGPGGTDIWIARFDASGSLVWSKVLGTAGNDDISYLQTTSDGGFLGVGSYLPGTPSELLIIKFTSDGAVSWAKTAGGASYDTGTSGYETSDGGFVATGITQSFGAGLTDCMVLRFDSAGTLLWSRSVGGTSNEHFYSIVETSDLGFACMGLTYGYGAGSDDLFLVKLNSAGAFSWARTVGGSSSDRGNWIRQTPDGGFIATGSTTSYASPSDILLNKFDSSGNITWSRIIGGSAGEVGKCVMPTADGNYIVSGDSASFSGTTDQIAIKVDASGSVLWATAYGDTASISGGPVSQAADGGYYLTYWHWLAGAAEQIYLAKTDASGLIPGCSYVTAISPASSSLSISSTSVSPSVSVIAVTASTLSLTVIDAAPTIGHECDPPTSTPTGTPTNTPTPTPTNSATNTPTSTETNTPTNTATQTPTPTGTPTNTPTPTPTNSATNTPTSTETNTPTSTATQTPTPTETPEMTATAGPTATPSPSPPVPATGGIAIGLVIAALSGLIWLSKTRA